MICRDAAAADLAAIDRVYRQSFCDTFGHIYDPKDLADFFEKFGADAWRYEFDDVRFSFRVAEADGDIVGYVKLGPLALPVETDLPAVELRQLYVLRDYHGIGIAHELMNWVLEEAVRRGAEELYLTVFTENHRAKRFYERYGFAPVGRYDFMVGSHADEDIIMRKHL